VIEGARNFARAERNDQTSPCGKYGREKCQYKSARLCHCGTRLTPPLAAIRIKRLPRSELFTAVVGTIHLLVSQPSIGQIRIGENSRYRTHRNAGAAMDTLQWVDVQHSLGFEGYFLTARMNAVDWTGVNTRRALHSDAGFSN
jgi:hypothetical protein